MILFDKAKLFRHSKKSYKELVRILSYITYKEIPSSRGDIKRLKYGTIAWGGDSFLLNPEQLLQEHWKYSHKEVVQYILLAAKRRYVEYKLFKTKTLPAYTVNIKAIEDNRLVTVENDEIYFKFEGL